MILLYSPRLTNRLSFILDTFLADLAGLDYQYTGEIEVFRSHGGPKINYSRQFLGGELFIRAADLLFREGIEKDEPPVSEGKYGKVIFPVADPDACLDFDPFAAAFYLLSLCDEYLPHPLDQHGRILPENTFVFRHGFIKEPVVEIWARKLASLIMQKFPGLVQKSKTFRFQPTFDIDQAFAYRHKGLKRNTAGLARDLFHGRFSLVGERLAVLSGLSHDPFDTYDYLLDLHDKKGVMPYFFILFGRYGPYDKNLDIFNPDFCELVCRLDCRARCGIHPSYNTWLKPELLKKELDALSHIVSGPVTFSRQHS